MSVRIFSEYFLLMFHNKVCHHGGLFPRVLAVLCRGDPVEATLHLLILC
jgi:hypothetical protein